MQDGNESFVRVFAKDLPKGLTAYWNPLMDFLCVERKDESCRGHQINPFFDLQFAAYEDEIVGFKLYEFSRSCERVVEMLGLAKEERVPLAALLGFYRGIFSGLYWYQEKPSHQREFAEERVVELIKFFGEIDVLQPEYARTVTVLL